MKLKNLIYTVLLWGLLSGCQSTFKESDKMNQDVAQALQIVAKSRIFFAHQSVGQNIVDGLKMLIQETGNTTLHILDVQKTQHLPEFYFAHTKVGKNKQPATKCVQFAKIIRERLAEKRLQFALLKFCFVDITANTDITRVFDKYRQTLDYLKADYPNIQFIPVTVPLKTKTKGLKAEIKRWFGWLGAREKDNVQRMNYNRLLKKYYHDEPVFDIATIESTYPDGSRETFTQKGKTYYALINGYSSDGGHLNETGRKLVAGKLAIFLSDLIKSNL